MIIMRIIIAIIIIILSKLCHLHALYKFIKSIASYSRGVETMEPPLCFNLNKLVNS